MNADGSNPTNRTNNVGADFHTNWRPRHRARHPQRRHSSGSGSPDSATISFLLSDSTPKGPLSGSRGTAAPLAA
jgi:hypothetical protein